MTPLQSFLCWSELAALVDRCLLTMEAAAATLRLCQAMAKPATQVVPVGGGAIAYVGNTYARIESTGRLASWTRVDS